MTRSHITVRSATESDVADLVKLWGELKRCGALSSRRGMADDRQIDDRVRRLLGRSSGRVLLASIGDEPVGMAMLTTVPLGALNETACVQVEYTVVAEPFRRRGVGRALMGAAAAYAEEIGAEQITVSVTPMSREANRFYAQLGLTPMSVRRVAPAAALRRRIAMLEHNPPGQESPVARRPLGGRTGMRAALRRMAIASAVAEHSHDS